MARISLWGNGRKGTDFKFIDRAVSDWMTASGTVINVIKYLGVHDQADPDDPDATPTPSGPTAIQDMLLLENRDRRYSTEIYPLFGCYNVTDNDFDMRQFGLFLTGDTIFIEFHLGDMIALLGRKIMPGDVLELPHLRDDALLDPDAKAINKYYVVEDASRSSSGYSPTWLPHVWRVKVTPMTGAEEYSDILERNARDPFGLETGDKLRDLLSTEGVITEINEKVVEQATASVSRRYFETRQFYVVPGDERGGQYPWIFAGDGSPPNGAELVGTGSVFPSAPTEGDYFLRNDMQPYALYKFESSRWRRIELDYRTAEWSAANSILARFINNTATSNPGDGVQQQKQSLHQTVKPRADF